MAPAVDLQGGIRERGVFRVAGRGFDSDWPRRRPATAFDAHHTFLHLSFQAANQVIRSSSQPWRNRLMFVSP